MCSTKVPKESDKVSIRSERVVRERERKTIISLAAPCSISGLVLFLLSFFFINENQWCGTLVCNFYLLGNVYFCIGTNLCVGYKLIVC